MTFAYHAPTTVRAAAELLQQTAGSALLAGGTDLLVSLRGGKVKPAAVIDLKKIRGLDGIKKTERGLEIGALMTMHALARAPELAGAYRMLADAAAMMGCYEIRHRATLGGNVVNASPGAESLCPLTVLEAQVVVNGPNWDRMVPLAAFVKGVNRVELKPGELLTKLVLPDHPAGTVGVYQRRQRVKGMDLASVNCAILVINPATPATRQVRVALGTVAPTPYRSAKAEALLSGKPLTTEIIRAAAEIIRSEVSPRATSLRATPEYKKLMIAVFLERGLRQLLGGAD